MAKSVEKELVYCSRVRVGNWYEASKLEEHKINVYLDQMKNGNLMLEKYRKMNENLLKPADLTQTAGNIEYGAKICLLAPHVPATHPEEEGKKGLLLGGRLTSDQILYSEELVDRCSVLGIPNLTPTERSCFVVTSPDYCNREGETECVGNKFWKKSHGFLMKAHKIVQRPKRNTRRRNTRYYKVKSTKPLYVRYDPNPIPGLCGIYPLYLSEHYVSNTRWRFLPVRRNDITRFEQEGTPVKVNTDLIVNHCATNVNLGINVGSCAMGFTGKLCTPLMKTCLDIYGKELLNNIWKIYVPITG